MTVSRNLDIRNTDEPCPLVQGFQWSHAYVTGRRLVKLGLGQAPTRLKGKVIAAFDAGVLSIGVTGATDRYMPATDLTQLAVGDVLDFDDFLDEQAADGYVIGTLTGDPTTGKIDFFFEAIDQFKTETDI